VGFVDFWDLSQPDNQINQIGRLVLDGARGEPWQQPISGGGPPSGFPTSIAMVRLDDEAGGDYLLFVHDKDNRERGWFYRGNPRDPSSWEFFAPFQANQIIGWNTPAQWGRYQNTNFVTECNTGNVYMIGMGNPTFDEELAWDVFYDALELGTDIALLPFETTFCLGGLLCDIPDVQYSGWGRDIANLYAVKVDPAGAVELTQVARKSISPEDPWETCNLRAGGGMHVTPNHELVMYCSPHGITPGFHLIEERRQRTPSPCNDASGQLDAARPGCLGLARQQLIVEPPACGAGEAVDSTTNTCIECKADAVVDWNDASCIQAMTVGVEPNAGPNDNCPDEFWLEVRNANQTPATSSAFRVDLSLSPSVTQAQCPSTVGAVSIYEQLAHGVHVARASSVETAFYQPECGGFCVAGCYMPDGPSVPRSEVQSGDVLRVTTNVEPSVSVSDADLVLRWVNGYDCVIH
jgi:hypothetical protein